MTRVTGFRAKGDGYVPVVMSDHADLVRRLRATEATDRLQQQAANAIEALEKERDEWMVIANERFAHLVEVLEGTALAAELSEGEPE